MAQYDLSLNPAYPAHDARMRIRYAGDGTVRSEDAQFSREIENVLNLNWSRLKLNRRAVTESVIQVLSRNRGARTHREIQRLIDRWNEPLAGEKLRENCRG